MADVDPAIPVVFLDTGWLFEETLAYRDTLIEKLGLRDVRSIKPLEETLSREDPDRELWFSDPDACCRIRKVEPLARALKPFSAWINGRKRFQGGDPGRHSRRRAGRRQAEIQSLRQFVARGDRGDLQARRTCRRIRWSPRASCRSAACPAPAGPRRTRMPAPADGAADPRQNAASTRRRLHRPMTLPYRKQKNAVSLTQDRFLTSYVRVSSTTFVVDRMEIENDPSCFAAARGIALGRFGLRRRLYAAERVLRSDARTLCRIQQGVRGGLSEGNRQERRDQAVAWRFRLAGALRDRRPAGRRRHARARL